MKTKEKRKEFGMFVGEKDWDLISGLTGTEEGYQDNVIKLKPRHYQAISFLLQGYSYTDVANKLDVSKRTVLRWFRKGCICYEILSARRYAIWQAGQQQLINLYSEAILEIGSLIHSDSENTRLKATSFILGNLKPEAPVNLEELSKIEHSKYRELCQDYWGSAYYVRPPSVPIGDYTKYAIDSEDIIYYTPFEYPEDGFCDEEEYEPPYTNYEKIALSAKQIKNITAKLNSAGVFTEKYESGVVIRDKEGFVVGELHPSDRDRPSYARGDREFRLAYHSYLLEYFEHRPWQMVTHRGRDAQGISHTEDLQAIIKMFISLGSISIPERLEEEAEESGEPITAASVNEL